MNRHSSNALSQVTHPSPDAMMVDATMDQPGVVENVTACAEKKPSRALNGTPVRNETSHKEAPYAT